MGSLRSMGGEVIIAQIPALHADDVARQAARGRRELYLDRKPGIY
jgi:hypothetical protein